jgi:hypothetical protein
MRTTLGGTPYGTKGVERQPSTPFIPRGVATHSCYCPGAGTVISGGVTTAGMPP